MKVHGRSDGPPIRLGDLIPGSLLASVHGDLLVSDPAVRDGDDVYEVNATVLGSDRVGGFDATEPLESWMLPETELEFLRCIAGRDDASYVERFISNAEKNHWFGEKSLFLDLNVGKTILNRRTKLVLHCNSKSREKTLNHRVLNASKPLKRPDYVLDERPFVSQNQVLIPNGNGEESAPWIKSRTKPYNPNVNKVPTYAEIPADQRHNGNRPAPTMQQHQQQQSGIFYPPFPRPMWVYHPPPMAVVPCLPGFVYQQQPWQNKFYQPLPMHPFPQPLQPPPPPPPQPLYFLWHPINNTQLPPVVTAEHQKINYSHTHDQQEHYEKNDFVNDECINKIISTIGNPQFS